MHTNTKQYKVMTTFCSVLIALELIFTGLIFSKPVYAAADSGAPEEALIVAEAETVENEEVNKPEARLTHVEPEETVDEPVILRSDVDYMYGSISMSDEEFIMMCRSIETEVTGEGYYQEKMNIAQVILNRVLDPRFPDTIRAVLTAPNQFSYSLTPEKYHNITISETTKQVVRDVFLLGWDSTQGSLYFCSGDANFSGWADYVFTDSVGHRFYKN